MLPDNWNGPNINNGAAYSSNEYTIAQWDGMEKAGAIFLPAVGYRTGTSVTSTTFGNYWTATSDKYVQFGGLAIQTPPAVNESETSHYGRSIRLVSNVVNN